MKVYSISKWACRGICLLILLLPVSRHWQLLTTGGRTTGRVTEHVMRIVETMVGERELVQASEIEFEAGGVTHKAYGPLNYEYTLGRTIIVFYNRKDPAHNCIFTFSGLYLTNYTVLPIILLTLWYAFYLSFNNYRRKRKQRGEKLSC